MADRTGVNEGTGGRLMTFLVLTLLIVPIGRRLRPGTFRKPGR